LVRLRVRHIAIALVALLFACRAASGQTPVPSDEPDTIDYVNSFDDDALDGWSVTATGEALKRDGPPKVTDGQLYLLPSWWKSHSSAALDAQSDRLFRKLHFQFDLIMNTGTEGMGIAWLSSDVFDTTGPIEEFEAWEAPSLKRSFGVGFDSSNPVNRDPFRGSGNAYDRPQHEVSLHFDGMEIVKRVSEVDFRDEEPHTVEVDVAFVIGGAEVGVRIDNSPVFERFFVAGMTAYRGRFAMGARNSEIAGDVMVDNLEVQCQETTTEPAEPLHIVAIDQKINDASHSKNESIAEFPMDPEASYCRVICTLTLDKPEPGFDAWDRTAHIFVHDDDGHRIELLRYITPYHRGHTWKVDVSDYLPLLRGSTKIEQTCGTQGKGWIVTVAFDFYEGEASHVPFRIIELWSGRPEIGNPDKPVSDFYKRKTVALPEETVAAKVRSVVTGHGMSPNSENAAEFMPLGRTLIVSGKSFANRLWKTDNYLNPCRPQGGTWKYDRAGWAPGDVVRAWEVDVTELIDASRELTIDYTLDEYVNENRGETWAPFHLTEAHLILYRKPTR
jgi:hypothetical protein